MAREYTQTQDMGIIFKRHSGTGSYWDILHDYTYADDHRKVDLACGRSFKWLAGEEKVPDVVKKNNFEGLTSIVRLLDTCYPYNCKTPDVPKNILFLSKSLYNNKPLEKINTMYKNNFQDAGDIIARAAISLCRVDYPRQIAFYADSEDVKEKFSERVAAMTAIGRFQASAMEAINNLVPGRAHPEIPFLEDDGLEDKEPARSCYQKAKEIFEKECREAYEVSDYISYEFCKACNSFASGKGPYKAAMALSTAKTENLSLYQQNILFLESLENARDILRIKKFPEPNFYNSWNYDSHCNSMENFFKSNNAIIAAKCAKEGVNLLQDGVSDRVLKDIEDSHELKLVNVTIGEMPQRPSTWIRFMNKLGFYKDTMNKYRQDLATFTANNAAHPTLDPIIDAGVKVGTAALALSEELVDKKDCKESLVRYHVYKEGNQYIHHQLDHLDALPEEEELAAYFREFSEDGAKAPKTQAETEDVNPVSLDDLIQGQPEKTLLKQTTVRDDAKETEGPKKQHPEPGMRL